MRLFRPQCLGCRNNNFGNIKAANFRWLGQEKTASDSKFCVFKDYKYGIRALYKLLCTYISKYHLDTTAGIIRRYASPSENATVAYMRFVDDHVSFDHVNTDGLSILQLMSAICMYESMVEISPSEIADILIEFGLWTVKVS